MKFFYIPVFLILFCEVANSQILIPFRVNKNWGLADTSGKIVLSPAYDDVKNIWFFSEKQHRQIEVQGLFFAEKNGKYGLISKKGIIMPVKYNKLYCIDSLFIVESNKIDDQPTVGSSRDIVYNLKGECILKDSIEELRPLYSDITAGKLLYWVHGSKKNSGMFWYDKKSQKIKQWIIKDVAFINVGYSDKKVLDIFIYDNNNSKPRKYDMIYNTASNKFELLPPQNQQPEPRLTLDDGISGGRAYKVKNNYYNKLIDLSIVDGKVQEIEKTIRNVGPQRHTDTIMYNTNGYDIKLMRYSISNNYYTTHSTRPANDFELEKIDTVFAYKAYVQLKKGNKFGFIAENKIIAPIYDTIRYVSVGNNKPFFEAGQLSANKTMKWGVINSEGKQIIPCIYDAITFRPNVGFGPESLWIVSKNSKMGLITATGRIVLKPIYEKVMPTDAYFFSFYIKDGKKYGYADSQVIFKPMFNYKVIGYDAFMGYKVLKLADDKNNFIGFADKKGFFYFK